MTLASCSVHAFTHFQQAAYLPPTAFVSCVPSHWLNVADHDNKLTGPDAVKFFERSGLPRPILAKVWALADSARKGYLDPATFTKVCLVKLKALQT